MGRPELGAKCTCTACHERFYDLNRSPAICPKCGVQQPPEKPRTLRPSRGTSGAGSQQRQLTVAVTIDDERRLSVRRKSTRRMTRPKPTTKRMITSRSIPISP